ncbi:LacI family DNA-binding transcriptional regulator [Caballeronia sordidicola]|uniref:LacI family DNA-binding transcriptional regulator n=1 Tax=Caballeronia sordidicola TaxID=196367 RepID=UPI00094E1BF1|nr:LacI family DNA-binding transcriptional regulator [Caballeronia sordidicola]
MAREASGSRKTVSKVLNGNTPVAAELQERVLDVCGKLNYQRHQIAVEARSLLLHRIGKRIIAIPHMRAGAQLIIRQTTTGRQTEAL